MEDWEQFFVEKSRRRAEKDRAERKRKQRNAMIAGAAVLLILTGSIAALALLG